MYSDTVNPGGEVGGCSVVFMLGMSDVSPFVFTAAAARYVRFVDLKQCFFKRGWVFRVRRNSRVS